MVERTAKSLSAGRGHAPRPARGFGGARRKPRGHWTGASAASEHRTGPPRVLAEKFLDVARGDGDGAHLPPAEDLERDRLAGAVGPEEAVERAAVAHVLAVDGEDDVARLQARLLAGAAGEEPGDDHVILDGVAEDAEPGARGGRRRAAAEQRVAPVQVIVGGDREREAPDLVQVERDHTQDTPLCVEKRAAAQPG